MKERETDNTSIEDAVNSSYQKIRLNRDDWHAAKINPSMSEYKKLRDIKRRMINKHRESIKMIEKEGVHKIADNISAVLSTVSQIPQGTSDTEMARVLSEKHHYLSKYLLLIHFFPRELNEKLEIPAWMVMHYQESPHCFD